MKSRLQVSRRQVAALLAWVCALAGASSSASPKLFLFAGQSNMVGASDRSSLATEERQSLTNALIFVADPSHAPPRPFPTSTPYTRFWVPPQGWFSNYTAWGYTPSNVWNAVNPGNYDQVNNSYGPEFTTLRDISEALGVRIYAAKYAVNGSGLDPYYAGISATWYPNAGDPGTPAEYTLSLYHSVVCWASNALAAARQTEPDTELSGFFWLQGESDALDYTTANLYRTNFTKFLQRVRSDLGNTNLPVVFGRIANTCYLLTYANTVRSAQAAVDLADTNAVMVNTDGLPMDSTYQLHYTDAGLKTVGQRFAQAWLNLNRPPLVANGAGATNVLGTAATLTGSLIATGGVPTDVNVCWGPADGGTDTAGWSNQVSLGSFSAGPFSTVITNLMPGGDYFYRCQAQNAFGEAWASQAASFTTLTPGADNNHDGLPDEWQIYYFGSTNANAAPTEDPDQDGVSNQAEFISGTVPTNTASQALLTISLGDHDVIMSFAAPQASGPGYESRSRQYTLERGTNLAVGPWQKLPGWTDIVGDDSIKNCTNQPTAGAEFYRLRVELK